MDPAGLRSVSQSTVVIGTAVTAPSAAKTFSVLVNGTTITARAARDLTIAAGDMVAMIRLPLGQLLAIARYLAAAPASDTDSDTPPPPKPVVTSGTTTITPVETRSYRSSGWRDDTDSIYQGQYGGWGNHTGCAFYGTKPRALKGVTVDSAYIRAKRLTGGDFGARGTTLRRITNKTRPSGAPTLVAGSASGPNLAVGKSNTHIAIPASYAQSLVDGTAGGLALLDSSGDPYVRLAGRSDYSLSFTLTIKWHK